MKSPMLRLAIPMIVGMCGANLLLSSFDIAIDARMPWLAACCCVAPMFFFLRRLEKDWQRTAFSVLAASAAFFVGAALLTRQYRNIAEGVPADTTFVCGTLAEKPQAKTNSTALKLRQDNGLYIIIYIGKDYRRTEGKDIFFANNKSRAVDKDAVRREHTRQDSAHLATLNVGDTIVARVKHFSPTTDMSDPIYGYYRRYLFRQGVCATAYTPMEQWVSKPGKTGTTFADKLRGLQEKLHTVYEANGIDGADGSIVETMTIGRRAALDKAVRERYSQSGVAHVLALSGFHVGVIIFILQWLFLSKVVNIRWRWLSNLLIVGVLWCYVIIAGGTASLTRAAAMCTLLLLCQSFGHQAFSLNNLVLSATAMLCWNPLWLFDVGFQLSFASVLGIVWLNGTNIWSSISHNIVARYLSGIVLISLVCTLATAPLVAYHFGQIPVYGILANLCITLLVTVLMVAAVVWWLLVGWWGGAADLVGRLLMTLSHTTNAATSWVAALPCATVEWHPSALGVAMCYALYALVWLLAHVTIPSFTTQK